MNLIESLYNNHSFSRAESAALMSEIAVGRKSSEEISALLGIMHFRGETGEEIAGFAQAVLSMTENFEIDSSDLLDVCGTGGDGTGTFNISTAAAIVLAACGQKVAKHGNRAVSSRCGSADVLEELGVSIELERMKSIAQLSNCDFSFFFAPKYHQAFAGVAPIRKALKARTIFNVLGPLVNPLRPSYQVIGVFSEKYLERMAEAVSILGRRRAIVVVAEDGQDEFSVCARSKYALIEKKNISYHSVTPEELGLRRASIVELQGGDRVINAAIVHRVLAGEKSAAADAVALNAAAGLLVAGRVETLGEGLVKSREVLQSGAAMAKLRQLREVSHA